MYALDLLVSKFQNTAHTLLFLSTLRNVDVLLHRMGGWLGCGISSMQVAATSCLNSSEHIGKATQRIRAPNVLQIIEFWLPLFNAVVVSIIDFFRSKVGLCCLLLMTKCMHVSDDQATT